MKRLSVSFFLAGFMAAGFLFSPISQAADTIKVGIVDTYTGPATAYSQDMLDAFKLAVEKINAKGGVLGRKIVYATRD